jgi:hypothetical protein
MTASLTDVDFLDQQGLVAGVREESETLISANWTFRLAMPAGG